MEKISTFKEENEAIAVDDIMLISKEDFLASKAINSSEKLSNPFEVVGSKAPPLQAENFDLDAIKTLQRDSSLEKLHRNDEKSLDGASNKKEYSNGSKPHSFNSEEFHSAHSKHESDGGTIEDSPQKQKASANREATQFQGKMNITQSQRPPPNAPQSKMNRGSNIFVPQNKYFGRYQQSGP